MTSNQRRPGFRLPWAGSDASATEPGKNEGETTPATPEQASKPADTAADAVPAAAPATTDPAPPAIQDQAAEPSKGAAEASSVPAEAAPEAPAAAESPKSESEPATAPQPEPAAAAAPAAEASTAPTATTDTPTTPPAAAAPADRSAGFMRDLVSAMRRVAEETRQSGLSDLRTRAEEQVLMLESEAEKRREELKARAERDVAAVGEWERAEAERIRQEAEQRVVARRAQLDQQLAAETTRADSDVQALRDRVAAYERELDAYHAQLSDISDPAAFASAAKQMPPPPALNAPAEATPAATGSEQARPESAVAAASAEVPSSNADVAARLAALEAEAKDAGTEGAAAEPTATEVRVKGLGSFGAITGFRQALATADGIEGVSLSLGPTGEFVFRAVHPAGFDVAAAIAAIEGDGATIEAQPDGSLRVTLNRSR